MLTLAETYAIALVAALLIGIVVAYWAFRRRVPDAKPRTIEMEVPAPAVTEPIAPPSIPAAEGPPDDLQTLKGVGAKLAALLADNGITRFDQLAALGPPELAALDAQMGAFKGRLERDRVVEQASYLARGDRDGYQRIFGNLGGGGSDGSG